MLKLHLEDGRSIAGLIKEYGVSRSSINLWIKSYREECKESPDKIQPNVYEELKMIMEIICLL
ncbi:MAG: hypothetical protein AB2417_09960 [Clostridiaceae bacterium]